MSARERYSASVEDLETVGYFLAYQKMGDVPKRTTKSIVERRSETPLAESASQNVCSGSGPSLNIMSRLYVPLSNRKICLITV